MVLLWKLLKYCSKMILNNSQGNLRTSLYSWTCHYIISRLLMPKSGIVQYLTCKWHFWVFLTSILRVQRLHTPPLYFIFVKFCFKRGAILKGFPLLSSSFKICMTINLPTDTVPLNVISNRRCTFETNGLICYVCTKQIP